MKMWKLSESDKELLEAKVMLIICIILFAGYAYLYWKPIINRKPIPHSHCEWHYIGDTIVTDCGYKITDGCPNCGKKICISVSLNDLKDDRTEGDGYD